MSRPEEPHNLDYENAILGAFLIDGSCYHRAPDLRADDFCNDDNRRIFRAMAELIEQGNPIDLVSVTGQLRQHGELDRVGGNSYLGELLDFVPGTSNLKFYVDKVLEYRRKRNLTSAVRQILLDSTNIDADVDQLIASAYDRLQSIDQTSEPIWRQGVTGLQPEYIDDVKGYDEGHCFNFGFPAVDAVVRRVAPGEVVVLLGSSGCYKSALQQNVLLSYTMKTGKKALFFSLEMPGSLVFQRTVQILLEQVTFFIESGHAGKKGEEYLKKTHEELKRLGADRLLVCTKPDLSMDQIEHYSRMAKSEHGDIGVIAIDYLGLVRVEGVNSEYEQMSKIGIGLKGLAKRLNLPVFALSQINRSSAVGGELTQHSAKGSGAINAGADCILGLYKNDDKDVILKILKNRSGDDGLEFRADLDAKFLKFRDFHPHNPITKKIVDGKKSRLRSSELQVAAIDYEPF